MEFVSASREGCFWLAVKGSIERSDDCAKLEMEMKNALQAKGSQLVIDLSESEFASSNFCNTVAAALRESLKSESQISIIVEKAQIAHEMLVVSGLASLVHLYGSAEAFISSLHRNDGHVA